MTVSSSHVHSWTPRAITAIPGLSRPGLPHCQSGDRSGDSRGLGVEQGGLSPSPQGECDITTLSRGQKGQRSWVQAARARPLPGMPGMRCGVCKADEATVLETATGAPGGHRGTWGKGQLPPPHHLWVLSRGGGAASGHRRAGSSEAHTLAHMCACVHTHVPAAEPDSLVDPGRWGDRGPVGPERRRQKAALVKQVPRKATQRVGPPRRAANVFLFAKPVDLPQGPGPKCGVGEASGGAQESHWGDRSTLSSAASSLDLSTLLRIT